MRGKNLYIVIVIFGVIALLLFIGKPDDVDSSNSDQNSGHVSSRNSGIEVRNFEECVASGFDVFETYPRECVTPEGTTFYEAVVSGAVQGVEDIEEGVQNCIDNGGSIRTILGDSGEENFCVFADGSMCEVNAYLRGSCVYGGY